MIFLFDQKKQDFWFSVCSIGQIQKNDRFIIISLPQMMQKIFQILLILRFLVIVAPAAISAQSDFNRYMFANKQTCTITDVLTFNLSIRTQLCTSTFPNTVQLASNVYYSTVSIDARIYSNLVNFAESKFGYQIQARNITTNYLITSIRGYMTWQIYRYFQYHFLMVFPSNPWIGTYMTINSLNLSTASRTANAPMPVKYASGAALNYSVQFRDLKFNFSRNQLSNQAHYFFFDWDHNLTNTTFTLQLLNTPYFQAYAANWIRFLVILITPQALSQEYPNYIFKAAVFTLKTGTPQSDNTGYDPSLKYPNYMYGLSTSRFYMVNDSSFFYQATHNGNIIKYQYKGRVSLPFSFRYSYAAFPYLRCNDSLYTQFNQTNISCSQIVCLQGQYFNLTNNNCSQCRLDCLTCRNSYECLSCNTTYRYISANFSCFLFDIYYQSNTSIPNNCSFPCKTCLNATACLSCSSIDYILINNTCSPCSSVHIPFCYICNQTNCILCQPGYRLINSSICLLTCTDFNCLICNHTNTTFCFTCKKGYLLDNTTGTCYHKMESVCGNGKLQEGQLCDDGNLVPWDGCDSACHIEPNYNCYKKVSDVGFNFTTYCAYNKSIEFTPISIQKLQYSNEVTILISVSQYQHKFWTSRLALSFHFIQTPVPYRNMRAQFVSSTYFQQNYKLALPLTSKYPQNSLFKVTFEYLQSIHNKTVAICFNFSNAVDLSLSEIPPLCSTLLVYPENNKYAHIYSQTVYQRQNMAQNICLLISVASVAMLIVSLVIGGKRIIVEMLIVIQITYFGLICVPKLTPMYTAMTINSAANNGYNILYNPSLRPFEDTLSDEKTKGVMLYSQFLYNLNTGLLFVLGPLLAGLTAFIVFKLKGQAQPPNSRIKKFYELALGEYTYVGLLFCGCAVGAASVLEIKFGMKDISTSTGMFSLVAAAAMLLLYPVYAILRVKSPHLFEEFPSALTEDSLGIPFQIIYFLMWNVLSALLFTLNKLTYANVFVIFCSLTLYLIVLIKPIFKKNMDRYRTQLNLLSIAFCQLPYLYSTMHPNQPEYQQDDSLALMAPIAIVFVLSVNFIVNIAFFTYETYKKVRLFFLNAKAASLKDSDPKQQTRLFQNPLQSMKVFKEGFVEVTEKDEASIASTPKIKKNIRTLKETYWGNLTKNNDNSVSKDVVFEDDYIRSNFENIDEI